ncbi:hypothetical protein N0V94_008727 [Neodidymelliopsis sp. IMI 364377]|nr:hypothetical protein N0V94_008727 [Neodidymelliopsis sp. IMI 364377]
MKVRNNMGLLDQYGNAPAVSGMSRNALKALDGGADVTRSPSQDPSNHLRKSFSFDVEFSGTEALAEHRCVVAKRDGVWTGGERSEISLLRIDNDALRKEISSLREEFQVLKDVLLQAETHRRWGEVDRSS